MPAAPEPVQSAAETASTQPARRRRVDMRAEAAGWACLATGSYYLPNLDGVFSKNKAVS